MNQKSKKPWAGGLKSQHQQEISEAEFSELQDASEGLYSVLRFEQAFNYAFENYLELERDLNAHATRGGANYNRHDSLDSIHLFSRRIVNLLSTATMYIDSSKKLVKDVDPYLKTRFKEECAQAAESTRSYTFCRLLRNFSLHQGSPISGIVSEEKLVGQLGTSPCLTRICGRFCVST